MLAGMRTVLVVMSRLEMVGGKLKTHVTDGGKQRRGNIISSQSEDLTAFWN